MSSAADVCIPYPVASILKHGERSLHPVKNGRGQFC